MKSTDSFIRQKDNLGSVVNTDTNGLKAYKLRKEREKQKKNEINMLKEELGEIKELLKMLIDKEQK